MGFFNAFGYEFYIAKGTTSDTPPVSETGLALVKNLSNAGIQSSTDSQQVITYDTDTLGWAQQIATQNSYTMDCTLNIDTQEATYITLKEAARDAAAGITIKWFRRTPLAAQGGTGAVQNLAVTDPSSGGDPGDYNNAATSTTGSGTGLLVDFTVETDGTVFNVKPDPQNQGDGYAIGDTVTIPAGLPHNSTTDIEMLVQAITGTGVKERHSGIAFVTNFSEDITAGNVAACSFTLSGYGAYLFLKAE